MSTPIAVFSRTRSAYIISTSIAMMFMTSTCAADRPNILWLTSEDHGPHLGCYGDPVATTPNVDKLASKGMIYTRAWSNAPVCAPARTTLITGMYATSFGGQHMRSMVRMPPGTAMYPQLLRNQGYYCTNNSKTDYDLLEPGKVWDDSSGKAHWRNRKPGQPFFAVFNSSKSHEGQIRTRPHTLKHDPSKVRVPAYHPDTPATRHDWAQYYDGVSAADAEAGLRLAELAEDGLDEDTIVFYYADHGSGMPRSKRWPFNSGLHVPLVVYIPEKFKDLRPADYRPGGKSDRLVAFVDFAPTLLSLVGVEPPDWMQGHAFLGRYEAPPQPYLHGFRGRMDERIDMVRNATDGRYVYIRNYMPHEIYGQHVNYMFQTPTTQVWKELHDQGKLTPIQDAFWGTKPPEELYDLLEDQDEVRNLAASTDHRHVLARFRNAMHAQTLKIRDLGFLPEGEIHSRSAGTSPYEMGHDKNRYPLERILDAADLASKLDMNAVPRLKTLLADPDSAVRYWGALGLLMRGNEAVRMSLLDLEKALEDPSPHVQIVCAEALGAYGDPDQQAKALRTLSTNADWSKNNVFVVIEALNAIEALGDRATSLLPTLRKLPTNGKSPHPRYNSYVPRLLASLQESLGTKPKQGEERSKVHGPQTESDAGK